jgi:hypothetical protein
VPQDLTPIIDDSPLHLLAEELWVPEVPNSLVVLDVEKMSLQREWQDCADDAL